MTPGPPPDWTTGETPLQQALLAADPPPEPADRPLIAYVEHWFWRRGIVPAGSRDPGEG